MDFTAVPLTDTMVLDFRFTSGSDTKIAFMIGDGWNNYFEYYGQWKTKGQYLTVLDNSYISLFLQYGLIMGTIMISTITLLIKKMVQEKNTKFLCFIISFLVFGLMENQMFNIMTNTTLIFISELIYNKPNNKIKE